MGSNLPRIVPIEVTFGPAIEVAGRYDGVPLGAGPAREVTDEIIGGDRGALGAGAGRRVQRAPRHGRLSPVTGRGCQGSPLGCQGLQRLTTEGFPGQPALLLLPWAPTG